MARADREPYKGLGYYCVRFFKWMPVLFITSIFIWSYYAYVHQLCIVTIKNGAQQITYLVLYHLFFIMVCWSYIQTIFTKAGKVPDNFKLPQSHYESLNEAESTDAQNEILGVFSTNFPVTNVNANGTVRYCFKCRVIKPDRAHHCSVCGQCVLKMDHHCPWINNCVCYTNYKFFILFLGYALLYCIYGAASTLPFFIKFWNSELEGMAKFHILFLFFVALMFAISLVSLFGYHCYLVSENRTTLEAFRAPVFKTGGPDKRGYNIGRFKNFEEVFGTNPILWFLPISSSEGDGIRFPSRHML